MEMGRPKKSETMQIVSLRLPRGMIEEIDRYTEKLQAETPLLQITRTEAMRYLVAVALRDASKGKRQK
jgi:hypothetical protein